MNDILLYGVALTALAVSDALLVLLGMAAWRLYHQARAAEAREAQSLHAALAALDQRLAHLEAQLSRLQDLESQARSSDRQSDRKAFEVAARLARRGAGVDELASTCGLTRGEAELIRMLHAGDANAAAAGMS
ncbi:MAG: DUF2802 domain-containing protein [Pseudomonadota bacterium]|nr:DUF2802 domain-containing protein [Pseudomonadota bacterium]